MNTHSFEFADISFHNPLVSDYLKGVLDTSFYQNSATLEGFKKQIQLKKHQFAKADREVLCNALLKQYADSGMLEKTSQGQIEQLRDTATFCITTGHQLNVATGPLYFIYKIIHAINLARQLSEQLPDFNFVPIYWMASEDHDFEEINHFYSSGKKYHWFSEQTGAVGAFSTEGIQPVLDAFFAQFSEGVHNTDLHELLNRAYQFETLAEATFYLVHHLFGSLGLLVVEPNNPVLKAQAVSLFKSEIKNQLVNTTVSAQAANLTAQGYPLQVNPRPVNLFYLSDQRRDRIVQKPTGTYHALGTDLEWTADKLLLHITDAPERFSPNVLLRPLYQECILPNIAYVGGGGEVSYWLQLKNTFDSFEVPFPVIVVRHSVVWADDKVDRKRVGLDLEWVDFFRKKDALINYYIRRISNLDLDFSKAQNALQQQFDHLREMAQQTDASFLGAVNAQEKKQLNGLKHLEKRLLKAQKRVLSDRIDRVSKLHNELFPMGVAQERIENFSLLYGLLGNQLFNRLMDSFTTFQGKLHVISKD